MKTSRKSGIVSLYPANMAITGLCFALLLIVSPRLSRGEGRVQSDTASYTAEEVSFAITMSPVLLNGTLTVPARFTAGDKVVILVPPAIETNRDYRGLYSVLADTLSKSG
ncbi:MAG: hypothetical protein LBF09_04710, partial [Odoribacteraceae bacterium]|nr:hypothetical protein [Odoribacteraceae bacterium]